MSARNYSLVTVKMLFARASSCAYPGCSTALVFTDRGKNTIVADIAHIRSPSPNGPRPDPNYLGDFDGEPNLLLLCKLHHKPVDDHESLYDISELEVWKQAQIASAKPGGTPISDREAKQFAGLSPQEQAAIAEIARTASRVETACARARKRLANLEVQYQEELDHLRSNMGAIYEVDDSGNRTNITHRVQLPPMRDNEWRQMRADVRNAALPDIDAPLTSLAAEAAVLKMMSPVLAEPAQMVVAAARQLISQLGSGERYQEALELLEARISALWQATQVQ